MIYLLFYYMWPIAENWSAKLFLSVRNYAIFGPLQTVAWAWLEDYFQTLCAKYETGQHYIFRFHCNIKFLVRVARLGLALVLFGVCFRGNCEILC